MRWENGLGTLKQCLNAYFTEGPVLAHDDMKLGNAFEAGNLGRIAGLG